MNSVYEYGKSGNLVRQLNYVSENGQFVFRSMRTFEYDANNMISKVQLHDSDSTITQLYTYKYDKNGNVIEENYLTYLFIPEGTGPKLLITTNFEYDSYFNPYSIFRQSSDPGISTNLNNIIKISTHNFDPTPGVNEFSESVISYEYNSKTGYPIRVKSGEEFIYD
jgi:YD repeat-containing protein